MQDLRVRGQLGTGRTMLPALLPRGPGATIVVGCKSCSEISPLRLQHQSKERIVCVRALFGVPILDTRKLTVSYMSAEASDVKELTKGQPRRYTVTHNDLTAQLHLSIGEDFNQQQISGWYSRLVRDEVVAEWSFGGGPALHLHCHVSGAAFWLASAHARNSIFTREMPLVLDSIAFAERGLFTCASLQSSAVFVHFEASERDISRVEYWGTLGEWVDRDNSIPVRTHLDNVSHTVLGARPAIPSAARLEGSLSSLLGMLSMLRNGENQPPPRNTTSIAAGASTTAPLATVPASTATERQLTLKNSPVASITAPVATVPASTERQPLLTNSAGDSTTAPLATVSACTERQPPLTSSVGDSTTAPVATASAITSTAQLQPVQKRTCEDPAAALVATPLATDATTPLAFDAANTSISAHARQHPVSAAQACAHPLDATKPSHGQLASPDVPGGTSAAADSFPLLQRAIESQAASLDSRRELTVSDTPGMQQPHACAELRRELDRIKGMAVAHADQTATQDSGASPQGRRCLSEDNSRAGAATSSGLGSNTQGSWHALYTPQCCAVCGGAVAHVSSSSPAVALSESNQAHSAASHAVLCTCSHYSWSAETAGLQFLGELGVRTTTTTANTPSNSGPRSAVASSQLQASSSNCAARHSPAVLRPSALSQLASSTVGASCRTSSARVAWERQLRPMHESGEAGGQCSGTQRDSFSSVCFGSKVSKVSSRRKVHLNANASSRGALGVREVDTYLETTALVFMLCSRRTAVASVPSSSSSSDRSERGQE